MSDEPQKCVVCFGSADLLKTSSASTESDVKILIKKHLWIEINDVDSKICKECWSTISSFHEYYTRIEALHHLPLPDIKIEENQPDGFKEETALWEASMEGDCTPDFDQVSSNSEPDPLIPNRKSTRKTKKTEHKISEPKSKKNVLVKKRQKIPKAEIQKEDTLIREYCKMSCEICSENCSSFLQIKGHYTKHHMTKGYVVCCNRKFVKRCDLVDHIQRHANPSVFSCGQCDKSFTSSTGLKLHIDMHRPETRPFKCKKCPKAYARQYQLNKHQSLHEANEDKKFHCVDCDRYFATKPIFQCHVQSIHEKSNIFVCDICAKVYRSKQALIKHRKEHDDTPAEKAQCTQCGSWHKNENSLKIHVRRVHAESDRLHICKLCGKEAPTKGALEAHVRYVHQMERNKKCTICEKAFKRPTALKEHMATHTGEVLYKCPYCSTTFNSSANMHSHKKKQHTALWEQRFNGNG